MCFKPVDARIVSSIPECHLEGAHLFRIIFRALQGSGGCGMYSMCMVVTMTMLPPERRSIMATYAGVCMVCSGVLGPVLGGAITLHRSSSTWPWVFWINLPTGCMTLLALIVAWPHDRRKLRVNRVCKYRSVGIGFASRGDDFVSVRFARGRLVSVRLEQCAYHRLLHSLCSLLRRIRALARAAAKETEVVDQSCLPSSPNGRQADIGYHNVSVRL